MFNNRIVTLFFSLMLISVVILTEVLDCVHREPLQNIENSIQDNTYLIFSNEIISHSCDVSSTCSHSICHSNHFCKANVTAHKHFFLKYVLKTYLVVSKKKYQSPYMSILLRPPIFI
jgi:hypothetical protein